MLLIVLSSSFLQFQAMALQENCGVDVVVLYASRHKKRNKKLIGSNPSTVHNISSCATPGLAEYFIGKLENRSLTGQRISTLYKAFMKGS